MCDNIVMFGPTHSGKSTLLGYLKVYDWKEDKYHRNNLRIARKMEKIGLKYKSDMALAYYVDKGIDERTIYNKGKKSLGTSKRIHIEKTALDIELNCTFIDTPGSDVAWKHKYEGLFLGDIGIFVIEIGKLTELSRKIVGSNSYQSKVNELFSAVYLWKHYKRMKRLIVVISKIDMELYSQYSIKRAENALRSIDLFKETPIIPISIDVENRTSCNIINCESNKTNWYKGNSLITEIKNMIGKESNQYIESTFAIAHVERLIPKTRSNNQPAIRVKILNGTLCTGDEIYLGPVMYNKKNVMIKCIIFSLKNETRGIVDNLSKGEIGGIIFSKIWAGRNRIRLTDVSLKRTSMVYQEIKDCKSGNLLYFNIEKQNINDDIINFFDNIDIGSRIKIIWFGKIIGMHIINIMDDGTKYNIVLINTSTNESQFTLPLKENGKLFYEQYVLQLTELIFVNAYLSDLETISENSKREVIYTFEGQISNINILKSLKITLFHSYDSNLNQTSIFCKNLTDKNLKKVIESVSKFLKNRGIKNYKINILPQNKL